ncbi:hypothetical protein HC752_23260 [Vibrio sp. S9_S30]|uniref:hypothetical protein n=1 Tax=Vibrio sp. S9_S30 TaxID=2720226 RepID=UPI0016804551|nr:hypothetical protein [Vibrio sp. S9_S30]MBD1559851.1 hypothetical protein [Vibrio sp. S9_S30]
MWCPDLLQQNISQKGFDVKNFTESIQSVFRTIDIYEYHKEEAYSLILKIEPKSNRDGFMFVLEPSEEVYEQKLAIQAHIQSAIHNARALYDLISQLINKLLLPKPIEIYDCTINNLIKKMEHSELKSTIENAIESESYKYINAFVNVIKHRNLVAFNSQFKLIENKAGILFHSFKYSKEIYPELWATDALEKSLNVKNEIITIGEKLNEHLQIYGV